MESLQTLFTVSEEVEGVGVYVKEHPPLHPHSPREIKRGKYIYISYIEFSTFISTFTTARLVA